MVNYCVVGSGRQGTAAAYDIIKFASPKTLTIIDVSVESLNRCEETIRSLSDFDIKKIALDITNQEKMVEALQNIDIFLSSVPYPLNPYLTELAIKSKTSMVDLGGHTQNVINQIKRKKFLKERIKIQLFVLRHIQKRLQKF